MKIAVIQFRTDTSGWHEIKCLYESFGVGFNDFIFINAFNPIFTAKKMISIVKQSDMVVLCGSGESGFEEKDPVKIVRNNEMLDKLKKVLFFIRQNNTILTCGICLGAQIIAHTFGGKIIQDESIAEQGVVKTSITDKGLNDRLFSLLDKHLNVVVAHKSSIAKLPKEAVCLARSDSNIHAFRIGKMIYGLIFHPELTVEDCAFRLKLYPSYKTTHKVDRIVSNGDNKYLLKMMLELYIKK